MRIFVNIFIFLFLFACSETPEPGVSLKDKIVTSDIGNFLGAYNEIQEGAEPVSTIQKRYFDVGSVGLADFIDLRITNAEKLANALEKWPEVYASIPALSNNLSSLKSEVEASFTKMQQLYPKTIIPVTYLLVGRRNSGGTVSDNGLLIGVEVFYDTPEILSPLIAHEMIHFQQSYIGDENVSLLGQVIKEGGADYLGELISGGIINQAAQAYGLPNECQLWGEFQQEMVGQDFGGWLYSKPEGLAEVWNDRPNDLGYFMGYQITKAYFDKAADPVLATEGYLNINDFKDFLEKSGYPTKMENCEAE